MASSKDAVVLDIDGHEVRVSNPEKPYFGDRGHPEDRRRRVLRRRSATGILFALRDRPTTLERWPGGVFEGARISTRVDNTGDAFYQKRVPKNAPEWVPTAHITFPSGRTADEIAPDSVAVVAWCANLGTLTFHPWPVSQGRRRVARPDPHRPRPAAGHRLLRRGLGGPARARAAGRVRHAGLAEDLRRPRACTSTCRSSRGGPSSEVRRAVIAFGRELERRLPDRVTMNWWKEERGEKIFIDYNQMARDRTIASAYSIRPKPHAPVSAPARLGRAARRLAVRLRRPHHAGAVRGGRRQARRPGRPRVRHRAAARAGRAAGATDHGLGDMPYPPDYPKMPGEPMRVQPQPRQEARRRGQLIGRLTP